MVTTNSTLQDSTQQYCLEHGVSIATSTYYRVSMLISFLTSSASAIYMSYFLYRYHNRSPFFHTNLKMLFFALSFAYLAYDLINIGMKAHHLALSYLYKTPCQIFLPRLLYIFFIVSMTSVYLISQLMLITIVIERWAAFILFRSYESSYRNLGRGLILAVVLLNAFVLLVLFYGQNFDELYLNGRMFPTAIYIRVNVLFITLLGLNFTGFVFTIALQLLRPKRRIQMPLSSKFQSNENTIASTLLFWITTFQFALYGTSQGVVIFIRIYAPQNPMAIAYKENSDFFNFLTLAMPILSTYYFRKVKRRRIDCLRNQIEMKSNGNDGWTNYSTVIGKQWNK
ncbi:hypothetical protein V3C99_007123 [Haemonchus contortus]